MRTFFKALGWVVLIAVGVIALFVVYPELPESVRWVIGFGIFAMVIAYHINAAEERTNRFRFQVERDLSRIKARLGVD